MLYAYKSYIDTKRAELVFHDAETGFRRSIHNLENEKFNNKFEAELKEFRGNGGMKGHCRNSGKEKTGDYLDPDSKRCSIMVHEIFIRPGRDTLMFQRPDRHVKAFGMPRTKLCAYYRDGSSPFGLC